MLTDRILAAEIRDDRAPALLDLNARMARLIKENRMADNTIFIPAAEFAARNKAYFPNESPEYRQARNALLTEEIELRRHIERVAALRRALPPGGEEPNCL